ncbi:hypothetical protein EV1_014386 [Malus domestica]
MEGLFWDASKLVSVGYGIKKLQIMLTIVDDLVSVDDLIEEQLTVEPRQQAHPHLCLGPALKAQSGFSPPAVPSTCSSPHTTGQPNAVINFTPQPQLLLAQLTRLPLRADVSSEPPLTTDNRRRKGREVAAAIFAETQFFTLLTSNSTSSG